MGVFKNEKARDIVMKKLFPPGLVNCSSVDGSVNIKYVSGVYARVLRNN
jgi:hypothetical protein